MIKTLYRLLLVTILSGMLITQSFAQATGGIVNNADGTRQSTTRQSAEGHKDEVSLTASITMGAIGLIASRLWRYKFTTDVMLATAGGGFFLWGELKSTKDVQGFEENITLRSDGKLDEKGKAQLATLESMKSSLEKTKGTLEEKKGYQNYAALAFLAAAAAALILKSSVTFAEMACGKARQTETVVSSTATCGVGAKPYVGVSGAVAKQEMQDANWSIVSEQPAPSLEQKVAADTMAAEKLVIEGVKEGAVKTGHVGCQAATTSCVGAAQAGCQVKDKATATKVETSKKTSKAACDAATAAKRNASSYLNKFDPDSLFSSSHIFNKYPSQQFVVVHQRQMNFFEKILNIFIPSAAAGPMAALLFGASGAAAGIIFSKVMEKYVDTWLFTPLKRAAIWGVLAGLSYAAAKGTEDTIKKVEGNITKVDGIIQSLQSSGEGSFGQEAKPSSAVAAGFGARGNAFGTSVPGGVPCLTGPGSSNCPSMTKGMQESNQWQEMPPELQGVGMQIGGLVDNTQGKPSISSDALSSGGGLAGSGNTLNKMIGQAKDQINAQLVKNKQAPIDFKNLEDNFSKGLQETAAEAMRQSGFGGGGGGLASTSTGGSSTKTDEKKEPATMLAKASSPDFGGDFSSPSKPKRFNFKNDSRLESAPEANPGSANDQYDMGKQVDINSDPGVSIFSVISERYLKSGYSKLLEEAPAAAPPEPETK